MLSSRLWAITGSIVLSSKFPFADENVIVVSFPITWADTCIIISGITGFTFPGIIDDPGCKAGIFKSPNPDTGPLPIHLISFAILKSDTASAFKALDKWTTSSLDPCLVKWFSTSLKGIPIDDWSSLATSAPKLSGAFIPVPTAVPPIANFWTLSKEALMSPILSLIRSAYPENSWPKLTGVASIKWVLPFL